jgi:flavodoxin short chain
MKKALIIYGTTTGNTKDMAITVKRTLEESGVKTELRDVVNVVKEDLIADHDLLLLGCPAYGDDSVELQEDFAEFYESLDGINLSGHKFAVFAPGDSSYEYFCGSVDLLEKKIEELGGEKLMDGLKVDGDPGDAEEEIIEWAESLAAALK